MPGTKPLGSRAEVTQQLATLRQYETTLADEMTKTATYRQFIELNRQQRTTVAEIQNLTARLATLDALQAASENTPLLPISSELSERQFEEYVILPMLDTWKWRYITQHQCTFYTGSQPCRGRIDVFVCGRNGAITIFENKATLRTSSQREAAIQQAKSYALLTGSPSFVIASPENMFVYSLSWNVEKLCATFTREQMQHADDTIRLLLLALRKKQKKPRR